MHSNFVICQLTRFINKNNLTVWKGFSEGGWHGEDFEARPLMSIDRGNPPVNMQELAPLLKPQLLELPTVGGERHCVLAFMISTSVLHDDIHIYMKLRNHKPKLANVLQKENLLKLKEETYKKCN